MRPLVALAKSLEQHLECTWLPRSYALRREKEPPFAERRGVELVGVGGENSGRRQRPCGSSFIQQLVEPY